MLVGLIRDSRVVVGGRVEPIVDVPVDVMVVAGSDETSGDVHAALLAKFPSDAYPR